MSGQTGGGTDREMEGQKNGWLDDGTDGPIYQQMEKLTDGRKGDSVDESVEGRTDGWMNGYRDNLINGWEMEEVTDHWLADWMDG